MMNTRQEILKAADTLFGKVGFDSTSIRDIAEFAGLNKSLVHYHYKNKDDLLLSVLDQYYDKLFQTLQEALVQGSSFRERVERLVTCYVDFLAQNINFSRIVQREASGGKHADHIRTRMLPFFKLGTTLIQQHYPQTQSGSLAAEQLLVSIYGMVVTYFSYGQVIEPLIGDNPLSEPMLEKRKHHLQQMLTLLFDRLEYTIPPQPKPNQKQKRE